MSQSMNTTENGQSGAGVASQSKEAGAAVDNAGNMLHIVSRASSDNEYDDVSLCVASLDRESAVFLLKAYQELLDGNDSVSYISIDLPFGMDADFLQADDELEERFAGDADVSEGRASEFTFEIVGQPLDEDKVLELQPDFTVEYPNIHLWRSGSTIIYADFKHSGGSVTSAAIPIGTIAEFFGLAVPVPTVPEPKCRIYTAYFEDAGKSQLQNIVFAAPDERSAYFQAAVHKIIADHGFRSIPDEIGDTVKKAASGENVTFNTLGCLTTEDFERMFSSIRITEAVLIPYKLIHADYA